MRSPVYDITPTVTMDLKVFPGDTPPTREVLLDMKSGAHVTVSTLRATVHLGAHVDAPSHYGRDARTMEQQPLDPYLGVAQVIHTTVQRGERLTMDHLTDSIRAPRVLLRTETYPDPTHWNDDFACLAPAFVDDLHREGVRLVGIDTPSVDAASAKVLEAHHRFLANDMAILEGIVLRAVPAGVYELIALPLKLAGFDGSPVRAVLRSLDDSINLPPLVRAD